MSYQKSLYSAFFFVFFFSKQSVPPISISNATPPPPPTIYAFVNQISSRFVGESIRHGHRSTLISGLSIRTIIEASNEQNAERGAEELPYYPTRPTSFYDRALGGSRTHTSYRAIETHRYTRPQVKLHHADNGPGVPSHVCSRASKPITAEPLTVHTEKLVNYRCN